MTASKDFARNPRRDKDGLLPSQKKFADLYMATGDKKAAAKEVWPDAITPELSANKTLKNEAVQSYMGKLLNTHGASREDCAENIGAKMKSRNEKASLEATRIALEIHGELKKDKTILPIPVNKEQYQELCREFWRTKPE